MFATAPVHDSTHAEVVRHRIMDAGERAFAEWGFAAASLRQITRDAGVNLAAVNYYFGSKEALYTSIIARGVQPINKTRIALLTAALEDNQGRALPVETILEAFCRPCFDFVSKKENPHLLILLGKSMYENESFMIRLIESEWKPVVSHFTAALRSSLPDLSEQELSWRFHFTVGAMIHTISQTRALEYLTQGACSLGDGKLALARLVAFCASGLRDSHSPRP